MAYVYILTNKRRTVLYTGATVDIEERTLEHKTGFYERAFTLKYRCFYLVWFEEVDDYGSALEKERQVKRWRKAWKHELVESVNPEWKDLSEGWYSSEDLCQHL